ncbi:MAG TPA: fumarylacetoacetase [Pusillimonas sp.]|uniref:fumarylacetoacetase n=1 Tax=Pusillimonas sp. TaxID=3040095 RepID=UPI002B6A9363|nr:fumarylacetoacetase [Pusillimonas sp.]HUH86818.1 fumarylacetoacetase [Pusillimonas sp.]
MNETHDPALQSWVASANIERCDFPIQNLPFGVFRRRGSREQYRGGVAIGEQILDLAAVAATGVFSGQAALAAQAAAQEKLNGLMALGSAACSALRLSLSRGLRAGAGEQAQLQHCLVPQADAEFSVPANIGDYTDFYTSIHHATNVGRLFRPESPLLPNYKWIPIGYHGRASSIAVSGHAFRRPLGQVLPPGAAQPQLAPSQRLDIELELGVFIGRGNESGTAVPISDADDHVFGICLLNDWSARDIQAWEYQPLGPFLSKSFATTISPWIVTLEALAPYRVPFVRPAEDPQPLPYLDSEQNRRLGSFDIELEIGLQTSRMQEAGQPDATICRTNYRHAYWTMAQLVSHHTVNGCNLRPGDLFGTGTLSGPTLDQAGALVELTSGGKTSLQLPNGETRTFLADGDSVVLRAWCERPNAKRIGFGECRGTVLPCKH